MATETVWLPAEVREAREAAEPSRCNRPIHGLYGAATFCGLRRDHAGDCSWTKPPLEDQAAALRRGE